MTSTNLLSPVTASFIQGQILTMIHCYRCFFGHPPSETELQRYFSRYSGPSILNILEDLERRNFIRRSPNEDRRIELLVDAEGLPMLQPAQPIKSANDDVLSAV